MTVRVANDFKTEAQRELERLVSENKVARDRIRLLEDQMHSIKGKSKNEREKLAGFVLDAFVKIMNWLCMIHFEFGDFLYDISRSSMYTRHFDLMKPGTHLQWKKSVCRVLSSFLHL